MRSFALPIVALLLLTTAFITGREVSRYALQDDTAAEFASSGLGKLGAILADLLWLQLDQYHHIWMYQGNDWTTSTEYLPQLWLITRLNPGFAEAYIAGGNHLAVNLGEPEAGVALLQAGIRNCPENDRVAWEYAVVLWRTGQLGPRATQEATWRYMDMVRRSRFDVAEPWNYTNCSILLKASFREQQDRENHSAIARRYQFRSEFIRDAGRVGLWPE